MSCPRRKAADQGDVVTQKQHVATFDTRAPACATTLYILHLHPRPNRNEIFLGGQRRGAGRLSPGLHHTSQQTQHSVQAIVQNMYVRKPPLVYSFPFQRFACFFVNELSKWPSIVLIDDPGWRGYGAMVGYTGETGSSGSANQSYSKILFISVIHSTAGEFP